MRLFCGNTVQTCQITSILVYHLLNSRVHHEPHIFSSSLPRSSLCHTMSKLGDLDTRSLTADYMPHFQTSVVHKVALFFNLTAL